MIDKAGFTTGGTDIINQILSKYLKISMGNSMLYCDGTIVLLTALVFIYFSDRRRGDVAARIIEVMG